MDPKYWKNPEKFDPSRFLTQDGSALLPRPECLIPFSTGAYNMQGKPIGASTICTPRDFEFLSYIPGTGQPNAALRMFYISFLRDKFLGGDVLKRVQKLLPCIFCLMPDVRRLHAGFHA